MSLVSWASGGQVLAGLFALSFLRMLSSRDSGGSWVGLCVELGLKVLGHATFRFNSSPAKVNKRWQAMRKLPSDQMYAPK